MTKKIKLTRTLMAAVSVVALSAVMYGCSSGSSDADLNAAVEQAKQEVEAAAKKKAEELAKKTEEEAEELAKQTEEEKQAAVEAVEKSARADAQKQVITDAVTAAETELGMVGLGASDTVIAGAEGAIQAITTAIEAAADVDDTSMYTAQVTGLENRLMTAKGFVQQDRDAKKMARADMQKGAITTKTEAAKAAVALVVEGASNEVIEAAGDAVQAAKDAISLAVDVDDTSTYTGTVDGIASSLVTAKDTVLADREQDRIELQTTSIAAAIQKAESALAKVVLDASDTDISDAEMAVKLAKDAIAAAVDVDDTSMYTKTVNDLASSLGTAKTFVIVDRAAKKATRVAGQKSEITDAITAANTAIGELALTSSNADIDAAEMKVNAITTAINEAIDVSEADKDAYTAQVPTIQSSFMTSKTLILSNRTIRANEERTALNNAITAAGKALAEVDADADPGDVEDAEDKIKAVKASIAAAIYLTDTTGFTDSADDLDEELTGRKAIRTAITDAKAAVGKVDGTATDMEVEDAETKVGAVKTAIDGAMHLTDEEEAAFLAVVTEDDDGLEDKLAAAKTSRDEAMKMAGADAMKRAEGLATALETPATTKPAFSAKRSASAVMPTLVAGGTNLKKTDMVPPAISGWHGSEWTGGTTEMATVYTDIAAPTSLAWNDDNIVEVTSIETGTKTGAGGALTEAIKNYPNHVIATSLTKAPKGGSIQHVATVTGVTGGLTFSGTFGGAMGTYTCSNGADSACSVTLGDMGEITKANRTFTFTPASGATLKQQDGNYLHFGWWIDEPALATGTYGFVTFYGGHGDQETKAKIHETMKGVATYNGDAAGVYVVKDIEAGRVKGATQGQFTAAARLRANFGTKTDKGGTIHGAINGFKDKDGAVLSGWRVTLDAGALTEGSGDFESTTTATMISGGAENLEGNWKGNFYEGGLYNNKTKTPPPVPKTVAGEFAAKGSGANIAGAFGANR